MRIVLVALTLAAGAQAQAQAQTAERGRAVFQAQCSLCHATTEAAGQGPGLAGIAGRPAGRAAFGYSAALSHAGFAWDDARLDAYLANPAAAVPGTSMAVRIADAADRRDLIAYLHTLPAAAAVPAAAAAPASPSLYGDWRDDAPGRRHRITASDLPPPFATASAGNSPSVVDRPAGAVPRAPAGFKVELLASGLANPRLLRTAPNGDVLVAETAAGRIRLLRGGSAEVFASGLDAPFGMAFYPPGPDPQWLYVAETNAVLRFPYRPGDTRARGPAETVVARLAGTRGGHTTRDLVFSPDGARLFVSVGSASNVAQGMGPPPEPLASWQAQHALGAAWGNEANRAAVLSFRPDGSDGQVFATGLRNCVGLAMQRSGDLWCSTNERDGLGDDLVPDYVTRVRPGAFYGWPWYYLGDHEDPRLAGQRPDLRGRATVPDVLIQPHSASLQMAMYEADAFPPAFRGAFAAQHGSWNRAKRTGYKVIRILLDAQGRPTGEYEDFLTGFVLDDRRVWGRPVGVAVAADGALLVSEDGSGTVWRVSWVGP